MTLPLPEASPETLEAATNFVESKAWIARMEKWGVGYAALTHDTIIAEIARGAGPLAVSAKLRELATNIPAHAADNLMRTLQLTSYREASLEMEKVNGRYIIKKIRIAALDMRTCLTCIALHGTELEPGERVDDHYRGRCTEYYVVPGGDPFPSVMQSDSSPGERNFVPWQNGTDWFNSLPEERQKQQASFMSVPGKWSAFKAGTPLSAFVAEHHDSVFGRQVVENSLIGAGLERFYVGSAK
jgi:hypothetical protein